MLKKLLAGLVGLTIMCALWSWAATTYSISTKITSLGTYAVTQPDGKIAYLPIVGGSVQVRGGVPQTTGIVYNNFTTSADIDVRVAPGANYKVSALTVNGTAQAVSASQTDPVVVKIRKPTPTATATQFVVASFAPVGTTGVSRAWQLQVQNNTPGGVITVKRGTTTTAYSTSGSLYSKNYTDTTPVKVTIDAKDGFYIDYTVIDGKKKSYDPLNQTDLVTVDIDPSSGSAVRSVLAAYKRKSIIVTTQTAYDMVKGVDGIEVVKYRPNGIQPVNPAVDAYGTVRLIVVPTGSNNVVKSFTANGGTLSFADRFGSPVTLPFIGPVKVTISNITAPVSVAAEYTFDAASSGQYSACTKTCHLSRDVRESVRTADTQWLGSAHKMNNIDCVGCHTTMPGPVVGASVSKVTFKVTAPSAGTVGTDYCSRCHSTTIASGFASSKHSRSGLACATCHVNRAHNPAVAEGICNGCHVDSYGRVAGHQFPIENNTCLSCHDPHSTQGKMPGTPTATHFNNITSAGYPASYVTSRASCDNCHVTGTANEKIRAEWAASRHAIPGKSWSGRDFKTESGCVQCHTTTGFATYAADRSSAAWGVASDKSKELLTCVGCHSDISAGTVRSVGRVTPYAADPGYTTPEAGRSNLCVPCHSGTSNGKSIEARLAAAADFTRTGFISPHYLSAAGSLNARGGYHFPGRSYSQGSTHVKVGMNGGSGPCISCHRTSSSGHSFRSGADTLCAGCHGTALTAGQLSEDRGSYLNALVVLRAQLAAKGFVYSDSTRSFANTNWGAGQGGGNTMGAAFNFVLLANEPGAYTHNPEYARQLIFDSIDFLDNGQFDDSVLTLAVPNLRDSQAISGESAAAVAPYKNRNSCTICHGGTAASTPAMSTNAHGAHITGSYGPGSYLGSGVSACQSCHNYATATHSNGSVDLAAGSCAGCHPGSVPSWSSTTRLECTSCHAAVASVLPNGVAAPYKKDFVTKGHGRYTPSNRCTDCHDPDSRHISGSLNSYTRLRLMNDNRLCAACHNNTTVRAEYRYMSSHTTTGSGSACLDCHDPHGSANSSMIRSSINGFAISYTGGATLVNLSSNRGLCQVCHTKTAHFRAGVAESNHPTSGCLGCHNHNAEGGAFRPAGGSCDSCHGYPPAPKSQGGLFGGQSNWANARFEDYSGGGGAHLIAAHISPYAVPSEAWSNCTICHNGGRTGSAPYHKMTTPLRDQIQNVTVEVDPGFRFSPGFTVYTGARLVSSPKVNATGSCFNISCHMSPSPRWSTDR
jgi:trimeric autotransporter adhesin